MVKFKDSLGNNIEEFKSKNVSRGSLVNYNDLGTENIELAHTPQFSIRDQEIRQSFLKKNKPSPREPKTANNLDEVFGKISEIEQKFSLKFENLEKKIGSLESKEAKNSDNIFEVLKNFENLQERVEKIEKKIISINLAENSLNNLESLNFSKNKDPQSKNPYSKQEKLEDSVKQMLKRIKSIEQKPNDNKIEKNLINKFAGFEDRLNQLEKVSENYSFLNKSYNNTLKKVKKIENMINSEQNTPMKRDSSKVDINSPSYNFFTNKNAKKANFGEEYESIIMGSLLDRVNNSFRSSPERPASSLSTQNNFSRAPSTDLKESLRQKGFYVNDERPRIATGSYKNIYKKY